MVSIPIGLVWKAAPTDYRDLLAIADRLSPAFRRAFLQALRNTLEGIDPALERGMLWGDPTSWQTFTESLEPSLRAAVQQVVIGAGQAAIDAQPESIAVQMRFDLGNPFAVAAVDTVVADAVDQIANANQQAVTTIIRRGFLYGLPPDAMSRRFRDYIGLTARDVTAVENYRASLIATDTPEQRVDTLASQYAARLLRQRATTIARTETIRAANAGQQAAWKDAQSQGLLSTEQRRKWLVSRDDRLCPICEAIPENNPDGVPLDEPFDTELGPLDGPPAHPMCRCVTVLVNP